MTHELSLYLTQNAEIFYIYTCTCIYFINTINQELGRVDFHDIAVLEENMRIIFYLGIKKKKKR